MPQTVEHPKVVLNDQIRRRKFIDIQKLKKINKLSSIVYRDLSFQRVPEILVNDIDEKDRVVLKGKLNHLTNFMKGKNPNEKKQSHI
jgi:hypothetical protein